MNILMIREMHRNLYATLDHYLRFTISKQFDQKDPTFTVVEISAIALAVFKKYLLAD